MNIPPRRVHAKLVLTGALALSCMVATSCKEDDDDKDAGKAIGAPAVEPPVSRNVPDGLKGASLRLLEDTDEDTAAAKTKILSAVKSLLSSAGNGPSFVYRLKKIDERMAELDKRSIESQKACLADGVVPKAYEVGGTLPGGEAAGMNFQCQEDVSGPAEVKEAQLAFGLTSDTFYLMERTLSTSGSGITVFAKAAMDSTATEAWEVNVSSEATDFKHIKAKDGAGIEATIAGTSISSGDASCGLHVKTNDAYIYIEGTTTVAGACDTAVQACFDAKTGTEVEASACTTAKLDTFELTSLTPTLATAAAEDAAAIIAKKITGNLDFTKDAEVPAE